MPNYVLYTDDVEKITPDEQETHANIIKIMTDGTNKVKEKEGKALRISHGKAFGLLKGKLIVEAGLPQYLSQGLFAKPGSYDVVIRLASAPGEMTDDSKLSTVRGMSLKIFGVDGPHLAPFGDTTTQDFVFDTGKEFLASTAATFAQAFKPNAEVAPKLSDTTKGVVSDIARGTNAVLHAFGMSSEKLDFYGHEKVHPMAEDYYSQTPSRYGEYIAKFGVIATSPAMLALRDQPYSPEGYNAFREAAVAYFRSNAAEFDFRVQLNTGLDDMSVEDAMSKWSEEDSQYQTVARLVIPVQDAYDPATDGIVEKLSFNPAHTLAAFRPLGSVNRARLVVYTTMANLRRSDNGYPLTEPTSSPLTVASGV